MKSNLSRLLAGLVITSTGAFGKTIPNGSAANLVLGQPNFTTNTSPVATTALTLDSPEGIVVDPVSRKVFVSDTDDNRVLRYASADALASGAAAEAVFGQANFTTATPESPNLTLGMDRPTGLFIDAQGRLWVSDSGNNRVLMFKFASTRGNQPQPDFVLGQENLTTELSGTTARTMDFPQSICLDSADRLWVTDSDNHRVLRFDGVSTKSSGDAANGVIGQPDFITNAPGSTAAGLSSPRGIAVSASGSLFVCSTSNNRIHRYDNAANLTNGASAVVVFGQADFTGASVGLSATAMDSPSGLSLTPDDSLWVADEDNNRVLRFDNASTKPSGSPANGVVGQSDFITKTSGITDRAIDDPRGQIFVDAAGSLWVPEDDNNRVMRFPADITPPLLAVTAPAKSTKKQRITIRGTASDTYGIAKVEYRVRNKGAFKLATGTTTWSFKTKLKKGRNTITIVATDVDGIASLSQIVKIRRK